MSLTDNLCSQRARKGTEQGVKREDRGFGGVCSGVSAGARKPSWI